MIRKATLADIDKIMIMNEELFSSAWSRASVEAEFHKDYSHIYLYVDGENVLGYIIFWALIDDSTLMLVATDKSSQCKGVASRLIEFMLSEYPCSRWFLEVDKGNNPAISLYERFGFTRLGEIKNYYGIGEDALRMGRIDNIS